MLKAMVRGALGSIGYRVSRLPANRFDAMEATLAALARRGYRPRVIVDGGANLGQWAARARRCFPVAALHLVEPQPACASALRALEDACTFLHSVALSEPGVARVRLVGGGTGAWVARPGEASPDGAEQECPATTLDALLGDRVTAADRVLLKLDLESHELEALRGAERLLGAVEVIVTEVQFYPLDDNGRACFLDLALHLRARGFELHDLAALAARARDGRLRSGDAVFVRDGSPLAADRGSA
jgi:FkbM family methyltransferase